MDMLPEVEVWYALPAIRRRISEELLNLGLKQKDIALRLGVGPSTISQYLKNKRGATSFPEELDGEFIISAKRILAGNHEVFVREAMRIAELLRNTRIICDIHHQHDKSLPAECDHCFYNKKIIT